MKNILIPTDFSENAHNAIRYALDYFAEIPVNFYILHSSSKGKLQVDPEFEGFFDSEIQTVQNTTSLLKAEITTCRISTKNSEHNFFALEEDSNLVEAIRKQVSEKEIDYILMGTKGASKNNSSDMGSNTVEVITKVKCPIMIIPGDARFVGVKNIAFVTDYNCVYRNKVISTLSETLSLHNAPLRVLHVKSNNSDLSVTQTDNKGFLHYFFREKKHSFHFVENKELETGIENFVETWEISLVSIVAKNLNFIQRLLLRPAVKFVSYHTHVPFLVIHE
ncbi:universal stress protein UspA-like protein [Aequorivita sublithincola DSM 14238]|uniref:Universal stress protein UspA-like protein n=1 Tax=Aequorivita sublithincola (strain DSM 14238 / LMG 21431 / ACAM 643 / 9-3) TaxID=746697 RepID=I3YRQ9_AEQSU|nr:universal stress protein [Aequorivita sublithincola]AFL79677.1 universal stress protein UspA-like protein [Aequorivita sublithincola DSM 14238]